MLVRMKKIVLSTVLTALLASSCIETSFAAVSWNTVLINDSHNISKTFAPPELKSIQGSYKADARIIGDYKKMKRAAAAEGVSLTVISAYRSYAKQSGILNAEINRLKRSGYSPSKARQIALSYIAKPGSSEHQTGLALDILTPSYMQLNDGYANTKAGKWLKRNAHNYGFILRYPKNSKHITGIKFEPWHYRYIGVEKAKEYKKSGLVYENFYKTSVID